MQKTCGKVSQGPGRHGPGQREDIVRKLVAIISVISWTASGPSAIWPLPLTRGDGSRTTIAIVLAAVAFLVGLFTYIKLNRDIPMDWKRVTQS